VSFLGFDGAWWWLSGPAQCILGPKVTIKMKPYIIKMRFLILKYSLILFFIS
jgi:hypothetical protein